ECQPWNRRSPSLDYVKRRLARRSGAGGVERQVRSWFGLAPVDGDVAWREEFSLELAARDPRNREGVARESVRVPALGGQDSVAVAGCAERHDERRWSTIARGHRGGLEGVARVAQRGALAHRNPSHG